MFKDTCCQPKDLICMQRFIPQQSPCAADMSLHECASKCGPIMEVLGPVHAAPCSSENKAKLIGFCLALTLLRCKNRAFEYDNEKG